MAMQCSTVRRAAVLAALAALAALGWPMSARAACTLAFAPGVLQFSSRHNGAVQPSELPGWRRLGQGTAVLTGRCDTSRASVRLALAGLPPASAGLLRWQSPAAPAVGAVRLRLDQAQVGGSAVALLVEGAPGASSASVDIGQNAAVVRFDLPAAVPANVVFSLRFTALGLVANGFSPVGATTFLLSPTVDLLP